mmetsp:Transcript_89646/g.240450  ORF Transcript_89646/g.240450 Transcript_89646/m.240450 type:complete len:217 (+) Transcript_89646:1012-1662(+)
MQVPKQDPVLLGRQKRESVEPVFIELGQQAPDRVSIQRDRIHSILHDVVDGLSGEGGMSRIHVVEERVLSDLDVGIVDALIERVPDHLGCEDGHHEGHHIAQSSCQLKHDHCDGDRDTADPSKHCSRADHRVDAGLHPLVAEGPHGSVDPCHGVPGGSSHHRAHEERRYEEPGGNAGTEGQGGLQQLEHRRNPQLQEEARVHVEPLRTVRVAQPDA